jgi:signal transduction histidine kinase/CHASE3 domain sensor protein
MRVRMRPRRDARPPSRLTRRLIAASGLLALVVGGGFAVLLLAIHDLRDAARRSDHSQAVLIAANELERLVLDLETGQRGFIATRDERFLQPWNEARAEFPARASTLIRLVAGNPPAERRAARIVRAERQYVSDYSVPLVDAARRGDPSARSVSAADAGRRRVEGMRVEFDKLLGAERRTSIQTNAGANAAATRASTAAGIGIAGSIALIALYAGFLRTAIVRPVQRAAVMAGSVAAGDLGARMPETGPGEVGALERTLNVMARSLERGRDELAGLATEQAALRRVATAVARGVPPAEALSAVARELGQLLGASITTLLRYEPDGTATVAGGWSEPGLHIPVGTRLTTAGEDVAVSVLRTGRSARVERFDGPPNSIAACFRNIGARGGIGSPINVEGRLWGVAIAASAAPEPLPANSEERLVGFTELAATAIANAQARAELHRVAREQAALRRVATLVARAAPPAALFAAVAEEVGRVLDADQIGLGRYDDPDGAVTIVAAWSRTGEGLPPGYSEPLGGRNVSTLVFETRRPSRVDAYGQDAGPAGMLGVDTAGLRSGVGVPITVGRRLWGLMYAGSTGDEPPAPGIEERLADFTELVATAIANTETQAELSASRARIVATADETRRRIERDLHDGAQQRLVSIALQLQGARETVPPQFGELQAELAEIVAGITDVLDDLREMARGIHPAILAEGGLGAALRTLARRSIVPTELHVRTEGRLPKPVEVGAYYVVSEALTNAAKHARATSVVVEVEAMDDLVRVRVRDDGVGGADFSRGSGLVGLRDRVQALGGRISVESAPNAGTVLRAELPRAGHAHAGGPAGAGPAVSR